MVRGEIPSAGEAVEDAAGAVEFGEALFFLAKFVGMGNERTAGAARRMLDVEHLMEEDVLDGAMRDSRMIETAIKQNLIRAGIVTAELPPPAAQAPANVRLLQIASEILAVQFVEHFSQVEVQPARSGVARANAMEAHAVHAAARASRARVFQVGFDEQSGRPSPVHTRKQQDGGGFEHRQRRAAQKVRETDENHFFAAANRESEARIRIKLDAETRRAAVATEACEHALKKAGAAWQELGVATSFHAILDCFSHF